MTYINNQLYQQQLQKYLSTMGGPIKSPFSSALSGIAAAQPKEQEKEYVCKKSKLLLMEK